MVLMQLVLGQDRELADRRGHSVWFHENLKDDEFMEIKSKLLFTIGNSDGS